MTAHGHIRWPIPWSEAGMAHTALLLGPIPSIADRPLFGVSARRREKVSTNVFRIDYLGRM